MPPTRIFRALGAALALAGASVAPSAADAGVIIPWAQSNDAAPEWVAELPDLVLAGSGSSSVPVEVPGNPVNEPTEQPAKAHLMGVLADAAGGASAPGSSGSGQSAPFAVAHFCHSTVVGAAACSQRLAREFAPQLPQPFVGELLDPPKPSV